MILLPIPSTILSKIFALSFIRFNRDGSETTITPRIFRHPCVNGPMESFLMRFCWKLEMQKLYNAA